VLPGKFSIRLRHVLRRSSRATSPDGTTAHRWLCLRTGSCITEARAHPPSVVPAKNHLDENGPPAFTLCHKASGPFRTPSALTSSGPKGER